MVLTLKIQKEFGKPAKIFLEQKGWLSKEFLLGKTEKRYLIFPLTEKASQKDIKKKFPSAKFEGKNLQKVQRCSSLKDLISDFIPEKYLDKIVGAYDVIGDIAVLEIPKALERFELSIAWALKRSCPYIKTVVRKAGKISGTSRIRPLKILTGEKRTETMHRESGIVLHLDLDKVYFSPRTSHERIRIAKQVKSNERVLVMFSGIAPFPLVIWKYQPKAEIFAVEANPDAVGFADENIRINRAGDKIKSFCGDVREILPRLNEKFDRIVMPYPEESWKFLELAFNYIKPKGIIHFYAFVREDKLEEAEERIRKIAEKVSKKVEIKNIIRAGSYAPKTYRYCFDVLVNCRGC